MKKLLTFLLIILFSNSYSQQVIKYEEVKKEIENSHNSLNTSLEIPDEEFYVGIIKDLIVENITMEPCIEIESNNKKNKKLIQILKKHNLLDNLYVEIANDLQNIASNEILKKENSVINLELIYKSKNSMGLIFIPIQQEKIAKKLISDLEKIFKNKKCFKTLIERLNT